jgi:hypothetical protein
MWIFPDFVFLLNPADVRPCTFMQMWMDSTTSFTHSSPVMSTAHDDVTLRCASSLLRLKVGSNFQFLISGQNLFSFSFFSSNNNKKLLNVSTVYIVLCSFPITWGYNFELIAHWAVTLRSAYFLRLSFPFLSSERSWFELCFIVHCAI